MGAAVAGSRSIFYLEPESESEPELDPELKVKRPPYSHSIHSSCSQLTSWVLTKCCPCPCPALPFSPLLFASVSLPPSLPLSLTLTPALSLALPSSPDPDSVLDRTSVPVSVPVSVLLLAPQSASQLPTLATSSYKFYRKRFPSDSLYNLYLFLQFKMVNHIRQNKRCLHSL